MLEPEALLPSFRLQKLMDHFNAKSVNDFAEKTNTNQSDLSIIAKGEKGFGAKTAYNILKTDRRLSIFWIIDGEGEMLMPPPEAKKYGDVGQDAAMVGEPDAMEMKVRALEARLNELERAVKEKMPKRAKH